VHQIKNLKTLNLNLKNNKIAIR